MGHPVFIKYRVIGSTTVTVTPECRPRSGLSSNEHMIRSRHEQDRMALIAFADGMQQVTLPSYEVKI